MAQIEWCQGHIQHIQQQHQQVGENMAMDSDVAVSPSIHYQLDSNQNYPEQIPLFLQRHAGDPAIKVGHYFDGMRPGWNNNLSRDLCAC